MKIFLSILVLIFTFQSWTKADDLRDFEIEGISIGDSLLDHFEKKNIEQEKNSKFAVKYKNNKFIGLGVGETKEFPLLKNLELYDEVAIVVKPDDKEYIIYGLSGEIHCSENIQKCFKVKDEIIDDLKNSFNELTIDSWERKHPDDPSGKSIVYGNDIETNLTGAFLSVSIYEMSDKDFNDSVKVSIRLEEYSNFLTHEAY